MAFSLDLGIEIDGARHPLLPILMRLSERGGMDVGPGRRMARWSPAWTMAAS